MRPSKNFTTLLSVIVVLLAGRVSASAQDVPRWEVGPTISLFTILPGDNESHYGMGGRGVLNFSSLFGADVQFAHASTSSTFASEKTTTTYDQFTANLKTTWRPQRVRWLNPFALSGLGMTRFDDRTVSPETIFYIDHKNMFAVRLGGGAEIIPHPRIAIRLDISDLTSRVPERTNCIKCEMPAYWWNQLDASISLMVRIGAIH